MGDVVRQDRLSERRRQEEIKAEQRSEEEKQKTPAEAARVNRARRQLQALEEVSPRARFVEFVNKDRQRSTD